MSLINLDINGNFNAGRGQFGKTGVGTLVASPTDLWTLFPERPHNIVVSCIGAVRTLKLPAIEVIGSGYVPIVGTSADLTKVIRGFTLSITVESTSSFDLDVIASDSSSIVTGLTPSSSVRLLARGSSLDPDDWINISSYSAAISPVVTLQNVYNNSSNHPVPEIVLNASGDQRGVVIKDNAVAVSTDLFEVQDNGSENQFGVGSNYIRGLASTIDKTTPSTGDDPSTGEGTAGLGNDSIGFGSSLTVKSPNTYALSDGSATFKTTSGSVGDPNLDQDNRFIKLFSRGELLLGGGIIPGITSNSGNVFQMTSESVETSGVDTKVFPNTIPLPKWSAADIQMKVVGKSKTDSKAWLIYLFVVASRDGAAVVTHNGTSPIAILRTLGGVGLGSPTISSFSNITAAPTGGGVSLEITVEVTNAAAGDIYWLYSANISYTSFEFP